MDDKVLHRVEDCLFFHVPCYLSDDISLVLMGLKTQSDPLSWIRQRVCLLHNPEILGTLESALAG